MRQTGLVRRQDMPSTCRYSRLTSPASRLDHRHEGDAIMPGKQPSYRVAAREAGGVAVTFSTRADVAQIFRVPGRATSCDSPPPDGPRAPAWPPVYPPKTPAKR